MSAENSGRSTRRPRAQSDERAQQRSIGRGTDQDLPLKVAIRRLLWQMGCSTRLDVRLRGYTVGDRGPGHQEYTDLDVLGIGFTPAGQLHTTFADCRSSSGRVLERMFWVRGVADFVEADDAYLVRASAVPSAARTLSSRLGVGILTPDDLSSMVKVFPTELDLESGPLACMFDLHGVGVHLDSHSGLSRKLASLVNYLDFDYWVYEPYRNLTQVVAHLSDASGTLNPDDRAHRTLFYDCAWHYALAIVRVLAFVRSTRMADVPAAVRIYAAGGELALREKNQMAKLLAQSGFDIDSGVVHPPYIDSLITLITRFLVHPSELADVLRYAEYLGAAEITRAPETVGQAFGAAVRPVAAKLFADICSFLVTSAGLRPGFKSAARDRSVVDLTGGVPSNSVLPDDSQQESGDQLTIPDS